LDNRYAVDHSYHRPDEHHFMVLEKKRREEGYSTSIKLWYSTPRPRGPWGMVVRIPGE
jgi:hypothetical protein